MCFTNNVHATTLTHSPVPPQYSGMAKNSNGHGLRRSEYTLQGNKREHVSFLIIPHSRRTQLADSTKVQKSGCCNISRWIHPTDIRIQILGPSLNRA